MRSALTRNTLAWGAVLAMSAASIADAMSDRDWPRQHDLSQHTTRTPSSADVIEPATVLDPADGVFPPGPALGDAPGAALVPRLQRQAAAGDVCAPAALGYLQALGIGMLRSLEQGRAAIARAGERGCARAHYLGARVDETIPSPQQRERVRAALEAGAALGDGHALNHLGTLLEIDGEREQARGYYREGQAAGNRAASHNLARLDRLDASTSEREPIDALRKRAESGDAQAQYRLARRIHRGQETLIDYVSAWRWYRESARQGFKPAQEMMALVLSQPSAKDGKITPKWFAQLALVDVPSDPLHRQRGVRQPVVDVDPFYDMR